MSGKSVGLLTMAVWSLYTTVSVLVSIWLPVIRGLTLIGHGRRCDDNVCVVLILKPLPKDIHV